MNQKIVLSNNSDKIKQGAKIFAIIKSENKNEVKTSNSPVSLFTEAARLESRGEYRKAAQILATFWKVGEPLKIENLPTEGRAQLLFRIGSILSAIGSSEQIKDAQIEARDYLSQATRLFELDGARDEQAKALNKIGITYWRNGDLETARIFLDDALLIAEENETQAFILLNIATCEAIQNKYDTALAFYQKAYCFIGSISRLTEGSIRNGIALLYKNLGKREPGEKQIELFDRAIIEFEGALVCLDEAGNTKFAVITRNNIGLLYSSINLHDEAIRVLEVAKTQSYQLGDKDNLGIVLDTLAQVYLAKGDYESATATISSAVRALRKNENSNLLVTALLTRAKILARSGKNIEAKRTFDEAENIAAFIPDVDLTAQVRLFALRELFSDYSHNERTAIFSDVYRILSESQETEITEALEEIEEEIDAADIQSAPRERISGGNIFAFESKNDSSPVSLEERIRNFERRLIEEALDAAGGNHTRAAARLGMKRQTMVARIKKQFPELLDKRKKNEQEKTRVFPTHSFIGVPPEANLKLFRVTKEFEFFSAGDLLLVNLGIWQFDKIVVASGADGTNLIGFLRKYNRSFMLDSGNKELLQFDEENLIRGQAVGYCTQADYNHYASERERGVPADFPIVFFE